mmetsp:Transcript_5847/g.13341  ORF Transcript_5847/g.13341 Transcript_5847/m.13341 type:complete len:189 (-) Transcript_5847:2021-2587(-)
MISQAFSFSLVLLLAFISTQCLAFSITSSFKNRQVYLLRSHPAASEAETSCDRTRGITSRREMFHSMVAAGSTLGLLSPLKASAAVGAITGAENFVGKFSDPINHPGGTRTIKLIDGAIVGDYQLAEVLGGGGRGEPKEFVLPAVVVGDRVIIIDFSPKGGPRDFSGVLEKDGSIKFLRDGNRWPRLE